MPDEGDIPDADIDVSTDGQYSSLAPGEETTNAGSTKSLSEHVYQVVEENGRQYCDNTYFMPNDEREQTRLNIVHQMYLIILEGRLTKCALPQSIKRILDVGSGPGDWALAMGDEFPNAEIIATDISVFDTKSVGICPPNVSFQIDDAQGEWTFNEPFDFIHVRGLGGGISDWSLFYQQAYQHLAPGGFIQVADSALLTGGLTLPNSPPNSYLSIYLGALGSAAEMAGFSRSFDHLRSATFEAAGFTDIRTYDTNIPVGTWPADPQEKTLGKMTLIVLFESLEATISIVEELSKPDGTPSISMKRRSNHSGYNLNIKTGALESSDEVRTYTYSWPGKTAQEGWRFGVLTRILGLISEAIKGGFISSKRDIFYQDPVYFGSQRLVDRYIDDIAFTLDVDRAALHVAAAAKGATGGNFSITLKNGSSIQVGACTEGILIPRIHEIEGIDISGISWILVIEKEAVFHRLITSGYHNASAVGSGILLTGKGYPDLSSREFLRLLSRHEACNSKMISSPPPIFILVDSDPDGMAIMSTYKYGSMAQVHRNADLNVPSIQWVGLQASEMMSAANHTDISSLVPMSQRDRKKAEAMLKRNPSFAEDGPEPTWRKELQSLLVMNLKAELEILYELDGGMEGWLDRKMSKLC
ncbi:meiotic recombination protein [Trichophyton mentagrophytes]|nr:meiotic recombination protein [Trichophyton mentagrophytes]